jgi:hypothetical protein
MADTLSVDVAKKIAPTTPLTLLDACPLRNPVTWRADGCANLICNIITLQELTAPSLASNVISCSFQQTVLHPLLHEHK